MFSLPLNEVHIYFFLQGVSGTESGSTLSSTSTPSSNTPNSSSNTSSNSNSAPNSPPSNQLAQNSPNPFLPVSQNSVQMIVQSSQTSNPPHGILPTSYITSQQPTPGPEQPVVDTHCLWSPLQQPTDIPNSPQNSKEKRHSFSAVSANHQNCHNR